MKAGALFLIIGIMFLTGCGGGYSSPQDAFDAYSGGLAGREWGTAFAASQVSGLSWGTISNSPGHSLPCLPVSNHPVKMTRFGKGRCSFSPAAS